MIQGRLSVLQPPPAAMKFGPHKEPAREAMVALSASDLTPAVALRNFAELAARWHGFTDLWLSMGFPPQVQGLSLSARSAWPDRDLEILASLLSPNLETAVDFETREGEDSWQKRLPADLRFCSVTPILGSDGTLYGAFYALDRRPRRLAKEEQLSMRSLAGLAGHYLDRLRRDRSIFPSWRTPERDDRWYSSLFSSATDFVFLQDLTGHLSAVNRAGERMTGRSREELLGMRLDDLVSRGEREKVRQIALEQFGGGASQVYHVKILAKNGAEIPVELSVHLVFQQGRPAGLVGFARDTSSRVESWSALREVERQLSASNNELALLSYYWDHLYRLSVRPPGTFEELSFDCLRTGCEALRFPSGFVAERTATGTKIHAGRTEGGPVDPEDSDALAGPLSLARPLFRTGADDEVESSASCVWAPIPVAGRDWGVLCFTSPGSPVSLPPRAREFVAFLAERLGARLSDDRLNAVYETRGGLPAANPDDSGSPHSRPRVTGNRKVARNRSRAPQRSAVERVLGRALEKREFFLRFQPQVHISGRIEGFEILLGWNHPELGRLSAGHFIPLAEESGLIVPIGAWVLEESCRVAARWRKFTRLPVKTAVNVSTRQFEQPDFANLVAGHLERYRLDPELLELEVTESSIMRDSHQSLRSMRELREVGVRLAIDDFGTGYSSLSYLTRLPVQTLKIDRSFLADMETGDKALSTIQAIVTLAHNLGLDVVGEGVERLTQWKLIERTGCDSIQGHLFGLPAGYEAAAGLLESGVDFALLRRGW